MTDDEELGTPPNPLDPRTAERRLLECSKCQEPVAASGWAGRIQLRCGYCNAEDERELSLETQVAPLPAPYRGGTGTGAFKTKKLHVDTAMKLRPVAVDAITREMLGAAFERRPLDPESYPDVEWERVWLATWLALKYARESDPLRARVTLETTLERTTTAAYRALLLAHLAEHAASLGATKLAKKWLAACPDVQIAEVTSELEAARLLVAWSKGRHDEVLKRTGGEWPGDGFGGGSQALAIALNLAARRQAGDRKAADLAVARATKNRVFGLLTLYADAFKLPIPDIAALGSRLIWRSIAWSAALVFGGLWFVGLAHHAPPVSILFASAGATLACVALERVTVNFRYNPGPLQRLRSWLSFAIVLLCATVGTKWLSSHSAPTAASAAQPASSGPWQDEEPR